MFSVEFVNCDFISNFHERFILFTLHFGYFIECENVTHLKPECNKKHTSNEGKMCNKIQNEDETRCNIITNVLNGKYTQTEWPKTHFQLGSTY